MDQKYVSSEKTPQKAVQGPTEASAGTPAPRFRYRYIGNSPVMLMGPPSLDLAPGQEFETEYELRNAQLLLLPPRATIEERNSGIAGEVVN